MGSSTSTGLGIGAAACIRPLSPIGGTVSYPLVAFTSGSTAGPAHGLALDSSGLGLGVGEQAEVEAQRVTHTATAPVTCSSTSAGGTPRKYWV